MAVLIQGSLSVKENLIALFKAKTPDLVVSAGDFTVGVPAAQVGVRNTSLELTATDSGRFADASVTSITYDRLAVESGVLSPVVEYVLADGESKEDLLARVVTDLGCVASEVAFAVDSVLPTVGETVIMKIEAVADSVLYLGDFEITVELKAAVAEDIADAIEGEQEGFDPVV